MTRTVVCRKYKKEMEGLDRAPYPGALGEKIFADVSKQAWAEWLEHQKMLINEKHLNLMDAESRKYLNQEMEKFLSGDDYDKAEGYVPPSEKK